jgi:nitrogen fixation/metabolism regulation signal transduction histidine kinase
MFESWTTSTWLILVVDVVAVLIVAVFLKRKIQHKLKEVEARQAHQRLMKRTSTSASLRDLAEE